MSIREELILKVLAKEDTVVDLAEEYGVARKTIGMGGTHLGPTHASP